MIFRTALTCGGVRQLGPSVPAGQAIDAGSNLQRRGSSATPSTTPSSASHVRSVSAWIAWSLGADKCAPGVLNSACSFQTKPAKWCVQLFAGAPTMTPS